MAKVLSKTGIITGEQVDAWHVTQSIDAFTKVEAYDITVSGSFTLTGSLRLSGSLVGNTTGTSSYAVSSSYSPYSETTDYALTSSFNQTDIYTLQFNHPVANLNNSTTYYMGIGNDITSQYVGVTIPVDSQIVNIYFTITNQTTGSSETSTIALISDAAGTLWSDSGVYETLIYSLTGQVNANINKGDFLYFRIDTPNFASKPFQTTHNVILTLVPYQS